MICNNHAVTFSSASAVAALFAELGATAGLEGGTPAEGFSQIPGEDGAFEATGAFACLLNEALPAAKQPKTRAQGFAGRQPDAGVEDASTACPSLPLAFLTLIPPSSPRPEPGLSLLQIVPAPTAAPVATGATGPRETVASGCESSSTPQPAELIPPAAAALASAQKISIDAGQPESPATPIIASFLSQSPAATAPPLAFSLPAPEPELLAKQAIEEIGARPDERGPKRASSTPIELRTAQIEPVALEAVTNQPGVPESAAIAEPAPPPGAPNLPETPEETASSGRQTAPRAEVAFAARIVERAPAGAEVCQTPSPERPTPDAPAVRRESPADSSRPAALPRPSVLATESRTPVPDPGTPAVERQTAEEPPAEPVGKDRQPTPRAMPPASPHTPDRQPETHEALPEKWMKLDSLVQSVPRAESPRTENQTIPPRPATLAAAAREMAVAEEPAFASSRVPVRELRFQVPEAGREAGVEIRVRDRANEVNVSVRTRSPELAQSLRQALPDLVDRLGQRGLEAQVWRPAGSDTRVPAGERSLEVLEAELAGNSPNQDGAGRGQTGSEGQRQPHPDDNQPGWTEEWARNFEASPDARDRSEWQ